MDRGNIFGGSVPAFGFAPSAKLKPLAHSGENVELQEIRSQIKILQSEIQKLQKQLTDFLNELQELRETQICCLSYATEFINLLGTQMSQDPIIMFLAMVAMIFVINNDFMRQVVTDVLLLGLILGIVFLNKEGNKGEDITVETVIDDEKEKLNENIEKKDEDTIVETVIDEKKEEPHENIGTPISIDLGTTNTRVGVFKNETTEIIETDQGNKLTSYVSFTDDGKTLIGDSAKSQSIINPENTISNVKMLMGRKWADPSLKEIIKNYSFRVIEKDKKPHIVVKTNLGEQIFAPEEISAIIIRKVKETAEKHLGQKVTHAVVTVPANYNDAQRRATVSAVEQSDLKVLRIANAPTTVAITYGLNNNEKKTDKKTILVYDLGGGNFDVSVISIDNSTYTVLSTHGDSQLGGEYFDMRVLDHFVKLYKANKGKDVHTDKKSLQKLRIEVEKAKIRLSTEKETNIEIKSFFQGENFSEKLTRVEFEELNKDFFKKTVESVKKVLKDAKMSKKAIDEIILVGGSSRIPKIQEIVKKFFDGKELYRFIDYEEVVLTGATNLADELSNTKVTKSFDLVDINPLNLGIAVWIDNRMAVLIPRNTKIPTIKSDVFYTVYDNQTSASIKVYEGEHFLVKDNHFLGQFELTGITPALAGVEKVEVTFQFNLNGILCVSAKNRATGRKQIEINYDEKKPNPDERDRLIKNSKKIAS